MAAIMNFPGPEKSRCNDVPDVRPGSTVLMITLSAGTNNDSSCTSMRTRSFDVPYLSPAAIRPVNGMSNDGSRGSSLRFSKLAKRAEPDPTMVRRPGEDGVECAARTGTSKMDNRVVER